MSPRRLLVGTWTLLAVAMLTRPLPGGDWPMWRYDAGRTAATPEALPQGLHLHWVRRLPAQRPAWPESQTKLQFDRTYEPVVADGRLFVGSTVNDSITAYDTESGEQLWRFYCDGPVRFAPAAAAGRVYAVSDDGYLYCLDAAAGRLIWKVNGGPADRPIVGNDRLVSSWPARGGVVLADGVAYFTASIWPSMGIFIHAVDAETGRKIWTNSDSGSRFTVHPHGASSFGSVVPQGYLAVVGDHLIVPGGRSLPAVFDRRTGRLTHFDFGGKADGGSWAMGQDGTYVIANALCRLADGRRLTHVDAAVIADGNLIGTDRESVTVQSIVGKVKTEIVKDRRGLETTQETFEPGKKSNIPLADSGPRTIHCLAGSRLYLGDEGRVVAVDLGQADGDKPLKAVWSAEIEGSPATMLAADDRLFVVTEEAAIYCFGAAAQAVRIHERPAADEAERLQAQQDDWTARARRLVEAAGARDGYAVALGVGSGRLIEELLAQTRLHVVAVDPDAQAVDSFRRRMDEAGLYGTRVVAHVGDAASYPFPPYFANLIVAEAAKPPAERTGLQNVYRALRPYGGAAAFRLSPDERAALARRVATDADGLPRAEVDRQGEWTMLRRVGSLPGSAPWTHQYGDATNSVVSKDQLVKAPLGLLWFGGPSNDKVLPRHGHGPSPQVAGGRLFIEGPDMLRAVDVYTGRAHWERDLPGVGEYYNVTRHFAGAGEVGSNYVSLPDHVYVIHERRILALDAATGETTRTFELGAAAPGEPPPAWGVLAVASDLLVATSSPVKLEGTASSSGSGSKQATIPPGFKAVVKPGETWQYLAGTDPKGDWTAVDFDAKGWKGGAAGFGYGDGDDRTELKDMPGRYTRVYIRKTFDRSAADGASELALRVNYDDAFIAYLNGTEIARVGVGKGRGAEASGIKSHEAGGYETFSVPVPAKLLRPGRNVLALEGHNSGSTSSDFSLDPYLIAKADGKPDEADEADDADDAAATPRPRVADVFSPADKSSSSRRLVVFDRHTGEQLWSREAVYSFRHNGIAVGNGTLFCIDGVSPAQMETLKRRGIDASDRARLLALDARTGDEIWSTGEDVFGTFLNYSEEHDVLLQAGSAYRDRAKDETGTGMVAYRGTDGRVLWKDLEISYNGPCLLWRDKIITNGSGGFQLELLTGERTGWEFRRMYGCNTVVGSEHLLTFRSGAAGYCDLTGDSGTGNLGGFRSSCTSNLIAADGVLNAPDYTRTCSCAYQNQTSVAWIHMPESEMWTFSTLDRPDDAQRNAERLGINLGAPGDRRAPSGTLWYDFPSVGGPSPELGVRVRPDGKDEIQWFSRHASTVSPIEEDDPAWVAASGGEGLREITIKAPEALAEAAAWTVRLHFTEPADAQPGERVFSVALQGNVVAKELDVVRETGGPRRTLVKEFMNVKPQEALTVALEPTDGASRQPVLCGVEIIAGK